MQGSHRPEPARLRGQVEKRHLAEEVREGLEDSALPGFKDWAKAAEPDQRWLVLPQHIWWFAEYAHVHVCRPADFLFRYQPGHDWYEIICDPHPRVPHVPTADHDPVSSPSHYTRFAIEPITFIMANELPFDTGNIIKYVTRAPYKGKEIEDLKKARRMIDMKIDQLENPRSVERL